jgi:hypothetical protein
MTPILFGKRKPLASQSQYAGTSTELDIKDPQYAGTTTELDIKAPAA